MCGGAGPGKPVIVSYRVRRGVDAGSECQLRGSRPEGRSIPDNYKHDVSILLIQISQRMAAVDRSPEVGVDLLTTLLCILRVWLVMAEKTGFEAGGEREGFEAEVTATTPRRGLKDLVKNLE